MRLLQRFFSRRTPRPADLPPDVDTWCAGDQAECVHDGRWWLGGVIPATGPRLGEVRVVAAVVIGPDGLSGAPAQFLAFARYGPVPYQARCFRKVTPRADEAIAGDAAELKDLLGEPVPEPVS